jgi:hypothetical protein
VTGIDARSQSHPGKAEAGDEKTDGRHSPSHLVQVDLLTCTFTNYKRDRRLRLTTTNADDRRCQQRVTLVLSALRISVPKR